MKIFLGFVACFFLFSCSAFQKAAAPESREKAGAWKLIFFDDFITNGSFDTGKWTYCSRQHPAWKKYITQGADYAHQSDDNLVLRMDDKVITSDDVPYHSGGVSTSGKFNFRYGKVEVRARFTSGKGSWPAIWMMPQDDTYGGWSRSGEIDIMEHVNNEDVVHQTIHNAAVTDASGGSTASRSATYNRDDYNLYGMIWTPDKIEFYVNNTLTYTYHKAANAPDREWPFDQPFYLILNQSGGAGWPGPIDRADLPFLLYVDWVKVYQIK